MIIVKAPFKLSAIIILALLIFGLILNSDQSIAQTVLDSSSVTPTTVDVSTEMKTVTVNLWMRNPSQQISLVIVYLGDPDTSSLVGYGSLVSGTSQNGKWEAIIYIPMSTSPGIYPVIVYSYDALFNLSIFNTGKNVTILGGDSNPPTLTGEVSISPTQLDVSDGPKIDTVLIPLQDDISGVYLVDAIFRDSSGSSIASAFAYLISGDSLNGIWQSLVIIPQNAVGPLYLYIDAYDKALNSIDTSTGKILTILGGDTNPPVLAGEVSISPINLDVTNGPQVDTVLIPLQDDRSGVLYVSAVFRNSSGDHIALAYASLISGDSLNGVWQSVVTIPQKANSQLYLYVEATDNAYNASEMNTGKIIYVTGNDTVPPFYVSPASISPEAVNVSNGAKNVTVEFDLQDNKTGVSYASVSFLDSALNEVSSNNADLVAGDSLNGRWSTIVSIPQPTPAGILTLKINAYDKANNYKDTITTHTLQVLREPESVVEFRIDLRRLYRLGLISNSNSYSPSVEIFNGFNAGIYQLDDPDDDSVWSISVPLMINQDISYAFALGYSPRLIYELNGISGGRSLNIPTADPITLPIVTFDNLPVENFDTDWSANIAEIFYAGNPYIHNFIYGGLKTYVKIDYLTLDRTSLTGVTHFTKSPGGAIPEGIATMVSNMFWSINTIPSNANFSAKVIFEYNLFGGITNPSSLRLLRRSTRTDPWVVVPTDVNVDEGTLSAIVQNDFSEWTFGSVSAENTLVPESPGVVGNPSPAHLATEININTELSWTPSSAARTYDIYFWKASDTPPSTPTGSDLTSNRYRNNYYLEYGTTYNWYVIAKNLAGSSTSQVWSFTTLNVADIIVDQVILPPDAYSGKSMEIKWVIKNNGISLTNPSQWYDNIYLSLDSTFNTREDIMLASVLNVNSLNPGESYINTATVKLPNGIFGQYYIFIIADYGNNVPENNNDNNTFIKEFTVTLTPPPDLQVSSFLVPENAFSGSTINVTFQVRNYGTNATDVSRWYDAIYLSRDSVLNLDSAARLNTITRDNLLLPDSSYNVTAAVNLPVGISGKYYLFVYTDYNNKVYEYSLEDNNIKSASIDITLTPPPDLVPVSVSVPSTGNSGTKISVQWSVQNQGLSDAEVYWSDRVFISKVYPFILDSSTAIGSFVHSGGLKIDSIYTQNIQVRLPDGISGLYHIYIETDWQNKVYEHNFEDNNISTMDVPVTIDLSPWPDLVVTSVQIPDSATAYDVITINWQILNQGAGEVVESQCKDSVYLSTDPVWNIYNVIPIGVFSKVINLAPSASISRSVQVKLPFNLSTNNYYVYIKTDAYNSVYEHTDETNNITRSTSFLIKSFPKPDLNLTIFGGSDSASSGKPYSINYQVQNIGNGITLTSYWFDVIYLSADTILDKFEDILVTRINRSEPLAPGASYQRNLQVTIPDGVSGDYYLIIKCDSSNAVDDLNPANNIKFKSSPIKIALSPSPDLRITSMTSPSTGVAGQRMNISWTVQNSGSEIEPSTRWYDAVYISTSSVLDNNATRLGFKEHTGPLGSSEIYNDTLSVEVPLTISGSYFIIVQTDNRKDIYEHGSENNNIKTSQITVTLPPPADLIVSDITIPDSAIAGEQFTLSWTIRNQGVNPAVGYISESVYLSSDTTWNYDDPLVGIVSREIDMAPGASSVMTMRADLANLSFADSLGEITGPVPGILTGNYHVIVRTNIKRNIRESDYTNNAKYSSNKINIDIPVLPLNVQISDTLEGNGRHYYKVEVPSNLDLRITAATSNNVPVFDVYASFGQIPTLSSYNYKSDEKISIGQADLSKEVFIPSTQSGWYYILLRSSSAYAIQGYSIIAETLSFSLASITPSKGGRGGHVTTILQGAGFRDSTRVFLYRSGEKMTEGQVRRLNSSMEMMVRWDLADVALGTYDIVAENTGGAFATMINGFIVEPARELTVSVGKNIPRVLLYGRKEPFTFRFTNTSNIDIPYFFAVLAVPPKTEVELKTSERLIRRSQQVPDSLIEPGKEIEDYTETETGRFLPIIVRDLAPGEGVDCRLVVRNMSYAAGTNLPMFLGTRTMDKSVFLNMQLATIEELRTTVLENPSAVSQELLVRAYDSKEFARYILEGYLKLGLIDAEDTSVIVSNFENDLRALQRTEDVNFTDQYSIKSNYTQISSVTGGCEDFFNVLGCAAAVGDCFIELPIPTGVSQALCVVGVAGCFGIDTGILGCAGILSALVCIGKELFCNDIVGSLDPNDMIGPEGYGDRKWVAISQTLPYRIRFENDSLKASAPAQRVSVSQQFDTSVDIRAFRLGSFGFANYEFNVPDRSSYYTNRLDLRDSLGIYVDVTAGIDVTTRKAFWTFKSVDPTTGEQPADPMVGLLPINDSTGKGEGFVTYDIRPSVTSKTGDSIHATARIIFDVNDPIDTDPIFNIVDAVAPQSRVRDLPAVTNATSFLVSWGGSDDSSGSGIRNYSIYVSSNDSPYTAWLTDVTDTMGIFYGHNTMRYKFISLARDNAGNVEQSKISEDAGTQIITDIKDDKNVIPTEYALKQNYPNPFNPLTKIRFDIPKESHVTLKLFNILGQLVSIIVDEQREPGSYEIVFDGSKLASGVYFYRLIADNYISTKKFVLMK